MGKNRWNSKKYLLLDLTLPHQASPGRHFIYLVLLNAPRHGEHPPIVVSSSRNLYRRLSSHAVINWHNKRFDNPPIIQVLGTIEEEKAGRAIAELTKYYQAHRVSLYKQVISWGAKRVDTFTDLELAEYLSKLTEPAYQTSFPAWEKKWQIKHKVNTDTKPSAKNRLKEEETEATGFPSRKQVIEKIRKRSYRILNTTKVSQKLSRTYNSNTGLAWYELWWPGNETRKTFRQNLFNKYQQDMSGDWVFQKQELIDTGDAGAQKVKLWFKLTDGLVRSIHKNRD